MAQVKVFWNPQGFELDSLGQKSYARLTDGDTPFIVMSIRMLSIDAPELHFPGMSAPSKYDQPLSELAEWLADEDFAGEGKLVNKGLAAHLIPRLEGGRAGTLHYEQAEQARVVLNQLVEEQLGRGEGKKKRNVFLQAADQPFDRYGRLLAYVSPSYSKTELAKLGGGRPPSFNYQMVANGWAASFIVYPSIPDYIKLQEWQQAAEDAFTGHKGAWAEPLAITGYEYRMCVRLHEVISLFKAGRTPSRDKRSGWVSRFCADMTTKEVFYPQDYHLVAPYNRIFIEPTQVNAAVGILGLNPATIY